MEGKMTKTYLNTLTPEEIIKRLKNGEVIKTPDGELKLIDGILTKLYDDGDFTISMGLYVDPESDAKFYFEDKEPFKITKAGKYRTRDGRIAYVSYIEASCVGCIDGYDDIVRWSIEGIPFYKDHDCDLVEYIGD
jgi:hypothetical protein